MCAQITLRVGNFLNWKKGGNDPCLGMTWEQKPRIQSNQQTNNKPLHSCSDNPAGEKNYAYVWFGNNQPTSQQTNKQLGNLEIVVVVIEKFSPIRVRPTAREDQMNHIAGEGGQLKWLYISGEKQIKIK